jgi:hypothetical protein
MTILTLVRVSQSSQGTFGVLKIGEVPICVTCEDPWEQNARGISCIPADTYKVKKFNGTNFKDVWQVMDVPGRDAILIHNGNTIDDTRGCILVGKGFATFPGGGPGITDSKAVLEMLRERLPDEFMLEVCECPR